ncbi:mycothiol synthase [Paeniglutamicibacter cryotolerans]|uniref:Mycothiol acetyltransferase n=1 Tax=Paeniglutamicibacter cryotolerans TaxID=670079 RepID=A0A839QCZ7_9MICC|nr:mycothiol synthase [Paeniglutamicibacter cryotolerans]MBB2994009.1 mycothiol synthase [Paeniglutamicibacter cryotolerans]
MNAPTSSNWTIDTVKGAPEPDIFARVRALATAAEESDGNPPLSEQTLVELRTADDPDMLLGAYAYLSEGATHDSGELIGAAVAVLPTDGSPGTLEIAVHPEFRNCGIGSALVESLGAGIGLERLRAWAHGNHEAAAKLAAAHCFIPVRELWRMRLVHQADLAEPALPAGVTLRAFNTATDPDAWLAANAAAFAHHPEQGSMTRSDLDARMAEDWFDPAGFLIAVDEAGTMLGFHWTKVHVPAPGTGGPHPGIGEVYVVGVVPEAQGTGLGKALTLAGIRHLRNAGLEAVMLYVDADNEAAVKLYRKLGFTRWDVDVMYAPASVE